MATLSELTELYEKGTPGASPLFDKVISACLVAAETIRNENVATNNHVNRLVWAKQAFQNPKTKAAELFGALLAANAGVTQTQIEQAGDPAIQSAVDAAIDIFADGTA